MAVDTTLPALQSVGNYDLIEKIAEGGMGAVYKGRHRDTGEIVAIKVVAPHMMSNPVLLKRFEKEYNAAKQLNHPNIVRAIEYGTSEFGPYLVMEYVDGETLGRKIEREGRLPEKDAVKLIALVAQGLHRAHKEKLIHRDVKPDNILISKQGHAKLADLGLVKEIEADLNLTRTGRGLGTPHFMAPEQFKNAKNVDARCDIYSLGATLYMMVTGEMPFRSSGPLDAYMKKIENKIIPAKELTPSLSDRIDWAIRRAMSADPDARPNNCREFVEDLTGRSTRKVSASEGAGAHQADVWYLVYKDDEGTAHTVKGSTVGIRRSLKEGLLGDAGNVRASRSKDGLFDSLRSFPEFRDMVIVTAPPGPPAVDSMSPTVPTPPSLPAKTKPSSGTRRPTGNEPTELNSPAASSLTRPVHLDIGPSGPASRPWPLWLQVFLLLLLVVASAVGGLFLMQWLK